jgi:hypothetical protein
MVAPLNTTLAVQSAAEIPRSPSQKRAPPCAKIRLARERARLETPKLIIEWDGETPISALCFTGAHEDRNYTRVTGRSKPGGMATSLARPEIRTLVSLFVARPDNGRIATQPLSLGWRFDYGSYELGCAWSLGFGGAKQLPRYAQDDNPKHYLTVICELT